MDHAPPAYPHALEEKAVSTDAHVTDLLAVYDRPDADAADLLCDRHPADAVAFTVVEADLPRTT